jgi:hypothetical protein
MAELTGVKPLPEVLVDPITPESKSNHARATLPPLNTDMAAKSSVPF